MKIKGAVSPTALVMARIIPVTMAFVIIVITMAVTSEVHLIHIHANLLCIDLAFPDVQ